MEALLDALVGAFLGTAGQPDAAASGNDIAAWAPAFRALVSCLGLALFVRGMEPRWADCGPQAWLHARLGARGETVTQVAAFSLLCLAVVALRVYGLRFYFDLPCVVAVFACYVRGTRRTAWSNAVYAGVVTFLCGDLGVAVANSAYRHAPTFSGPFEGIAIEGLYAAVVLGLCLFVRRWAPTSPEASVRPAGLGALLLALLPYIVVRSSSLLYSAEGSDALTMECMLLVTIVATFGAVLGNYNAILAESERARRLQLEMEMREHQRRYQVRRETMAEVNRRYHDMVKYARTLSGAGCAAGPGCATGPDCVVCTAGPTGNPGAKAKGCAAPSDAAAPLDPRLVERMTQGLSEASLLRETGSGVLDMLLWERGETCREEGLRFVPQVDAAPEDLACLDDFDLHTIVGNALDNAIEAAAQVDDPARREVRLRLSRVGGMLFLKVENGFTGTLRRAGGRPDGRLLTTKDDTTGAHGHGLENIRRTVGRLGGSLACEDEDGRFTLTAMVPLPGR